MLFLNALKNNALTEDISKERKLQSNSKFAYLRLLFLYIYIYIYISKARQFIDNLICHISEIFHFLQSEKKTAILSALKPEVRCLIGDPKIFTWLYDRDFLHRVVVRSMSLARCIASRRCIKTMPLVNACADVVLVRCYVPA